VNACRNTFGNLAEKRNPHLPWASRRHGPNFWPLPWGGVSASGDGDCSCSLGCRRRTILARRTHASLSRSVILGVSCRRIGDKSTNSSHGQLRTSLPRSRREAPARASCESSSVFLNVRSSCLRQAHCQPYVIIDLIAIQFRSSV